MSGNTQYGLSIATGGEGDHTFVSIESASLATVAYAVKDVLAEIGDGKGTFAVDFGLADSEDSLVQLTADAETVGTVLKARLAKLRKASKPASVSE